MHTHSKWYDGYVSYSVIFFTAILQWHYLTELRTVSNMAAPVVSLPSLISHKNGVSYVVITFVLPTLDIILIGIRVSTIIVVPVTLANHLE